MSCAAPSMLRLRSNWTVIEVLPRMLVELMFGNAPRSAQTAASSGDATDDAMVSGLAPGREGRDLDRREVDLWQRRKPASIG